MEPMIVAELAAALAADEAVALATVVRTDRSVPRHAGSKMLVYRDGRSSGTIGGGEMEHRVVAEALEALGDGRPRMLEYALVDPASGDPGVCGGTVEIYVEPHMPQPTLYIVGAGHVGRAVAHLAGWLGYRVVVWDDRDEVAGDIDGVAASYSGSIDEALTAEPITADTSIVVVTRNVALDAELLPPLLATPARYIGVMGSNRRWSTTRAKLTDAGLAESELERVRSPIGIEIAAETPEEIAVSIMAEVVRHRRDA